jgi:hypothetical protein
MRYPEFKIGNRVEWSRAGQKDHATVTNVRPHPTIAGKQQIELKVDGWFTGDQPWGWENADYCFARIS